MHIHEHLVCNNPGNRGTKPYECIYIFMTHVLCIFYVTKQKTIFIYFECFFLWKETNSAGFIKYMYITFY